MNWNADCAPSLLAQHQCPISLMLLWLKEHKSTQPRSKIQWKAFPEEWRLLLQQQTGTKFETGCSISTYECYGHVAISFWSYCVLLSYHTSAEISTMLDIESHLFLLVFCGPALIKSKSTVKCRNVHFLIIWTFKYRNRATFLYSTLLYMHMSGQYHPWRLWLHELTS